MSELPKTPPVATEFPVSTIEAAAYAASEFRNSVAAVRAIAAVAGKVMTIPNVKMAEVIAAWAYKRMDACKTLEDQKKVLDDDLLKFGPEVAAIINSLHVPPGTSNELMQELFVKSSDSAKLIRVCETIVGLADTYRELSSGSPSRLREAQLLLNYAQFVYNNSVSRVAPTVLGELRQLIIATSSIWSAVSATVEAFETRVNPPDMIPVKIVAVCNELGTVAVVMMKPSSTTEDARKAADDAKGKIGGALHSESVLYATIPAPKQIEVKGVALPEIGAANPAS
jgi:hypothetical protein